MLGVEKGMVKKALAQMNRWFNAHIIEKNPIIVEEMMRYNQMHGRIKEHGARAKMVAGLYLRYGIFHKNPLLEFEKDSAASPFQKVNIPVKHRLRK